MTNAGIRDIVLGLGLPGAADVAMWDLGAAFLAGVVFHPALERRWLRI